jgi:hypothetical protein
MLCPVLLRATILMLLAAVPIGCEDREIRAYRVPKEQPPGDTAQSQPGGQVTWAVPETWSPGDNANDMRVATFSTPSGVEVALSAFPGQAGGLLSNVNRWREQIGLAGLTEDELFDAVETDLIDGVALATMDMTGDQRLLGAVLAPGDGQSWFIKATGEPDAMDQLKPEFEAFARSFALEQEPAPTGASSPIEARIAEWTPPDDWVPDAEPSTIVAAAYTTPGGVRVTATSLRGDGGGTLANINRWRGQIGLEPMPTLDDQPKDDLGDGILVVDLIADDGAGRIVAAIVPEGERTWYFKMTGTAEPIEADRKTFDRMIRQIGLGEQP